MFSVIALVAAIAFGLTVDLATHRMWLGMVVSVMVMSALYPWSRRRDKRRTDRRAGEAATRDRRFFDR